MSTLDPVGDFYLPGPAARETELEPRAETQQVVDEVPPIDDDDAGRQGGGWRSALTAMLLMSGLAAGGWHVLQPDTLPIRRVNIEGEFRQLSRAALQALVAEHLHGGFFSVDVNALREAMQGNPWVHEVRIQRAWPDALDISVREEVAVARWNETGLVNADGEYFEPPPANRPEGLPQITGPEGMQAQLAGQLRHLQSLLAPLGLRIQKLSLSERRAWSFETDSGLQVVFGREAFDVRLARFMELVPGSLGERLKEAAYIDMRYTNGFAVRFKEASGTPDEGPSKGNGAA